MSGQVFATSPAFNLWGYSQTQIKHKQDRGILLGNEDGQKVFMCISNPQYT